MLKKSLFIRILTIASLLLVNLQWGKVTASPVNSETQSTILFVKPGADGDCLSWDTACELQTALFNATDGDQIWVASGIYKPTTSLNRDATFRLKSGVAIYGGFPADGGVFGDRDWETYETILSGDIGVVGVSTDNSYNVVTAIGVDDTTILDGFTVSDGNGLVGGGINNDESNPVISNIIISGNTAVDGGGMSNDNSSPVLTNVTFINNSARYGGGMYNHNVNSLFTNVNFIDNTAELGGGLYNNIGASFTLQTGNFSGNSASSGGGGLYNSGYGKVMLQDVTFSGNSAYYAGGGISNSNNNLTLVDVIFVNNSSPNKGGGMSNSRCSPTLKNVTFSGNSAEYGGGIYNYNQSNPLLTNIIFSENSADFGGGLYNYDECNPTLNNVTFSGNSANNNGGGIANEENSNPLLTNVTFSSNTATNFGGGISNYSCVPIMTNVTFFGNSATTGGGIYNEHYSHSQLRNSIVWGNTPDQIYSTENSSPIVEYSDIQGDFVGDGNIEDDPKLGGLEDNGGFTLTHALGTDSPAIDKGNPEVCPVVDQRAYTRPTDGDNDGKEGCDMGAYEYNSFPAVFSLILDDVGNGSVIAIPEKSDYYYGEVVTLTAIADSDWVFNGWGGDVSSMENPLTITLYDDTSITANFMFDAWVLTVSIFPEGAGTVSLNPDTPTYPYMSYVSATAIPNPGWTFAGWSGDATGTTNPTSVTMTSHKSITATFSQDEYSLDVTVNPEGVGSVEISPSKPNYHYGEIVTLTATPATGWKFTGWSGDATGATTPLEVTITGDTNITANFSDQYTLLTNVLPLGSGTVTRDIIQDTYGYETQVTLTALPATGWKFDKWSGDASGSENPLLHTIVGDTDISANFTKEEYTLTVEVNPEGKGSVAISPLQETYHYGDVVTLTATPATGWKFYGWSGDKTSTANPLVLTIVDNTNVTANFTDIFYIYLPLILKN